MVLGSDSLFCFFCNAPLGARVEGLGLGIRVQGLRSWV